MVFCAIGLGEQENTLFVMAKTAQFHQFFFAHQHRYRKAVAHAFAKGREVRHDIVKMLSPMQV